MFHKGEMDYFAYVLRNDRDRRYIGVSCDPQTHLNQHNMGVSIWTAKHGPWSLAWKSRAMSLSDARRLENLLKRQKGGSGLEALLRGYGS